MLNLKTRPPKAYEDRSRLYVKIDGQRIPLGRADCDESREAYDRLIAEWLSNGRRLPASIDDENEPTTVTERRASASGHHDQLYGGHGPQSS